MDAIKIAKVNGVTLTKISGPASPSSPEHFPRGSSPVWLGTLHLTTHHLIFRGADEGAGVELWLPYPLLWSVTRLPADLTGTKNPLEVRLRDFEAYSIVMRDESEALDVWESLRNISMGTDSLSQLYAFFYTPSTSHASPPSSSPFWSIYNPSREFSRMGISSSPSTGRTVAWRFTTVNKDFSYCPTYPQHIMVPARISDTTLNYAVKYRSKGRIPGLVYLHWGNFGSITRSSQPMVGLKNNRSIQDEKLIECIFSSHLHTHPPTPNPTSPTSAPTSLVSQIPSEPGSKIDIYGATATNMIIDARPTTNAVANVAKGAGTENMDYYRGCRKVYLGIDNIHVMRDSMNKLNEALKLADTTGVVDRSLLRRTNWLKHLSNILEGTLTIVKNVHIYSSHVLVHCSDGWDRTSQLCALPQLCLDPFYRTAFGYVTLVEKDWLSYGHKFEDRTGHLVRDRTTFDVRHALPLDGERGYIENGAAFLASVQKRLEGKSSAFKETCPVFLQYLDCTWQVMRQFPNRFEFNELFLRRMGYHVFSCQYGTFLWNCERDRLEDEAAKRTRSVWEELLDYDSSSDTFKLKEEYRNPLYRPELDEREKGKRAEDSDLGVLLVDPQDVKFWAEWFGREEEEMNFRDEYGASKTEPDQEIVVENSQQDPVLESANSMSGSNGFLGDLKRSQSLSLPRVSLGRRQVNASPRSGTPIAEEEGPSVIQERLQTGLQSALKWGGSTWKTVSARYSDAINQLNAVPPSNANETEIGSTPLSGSGGSNTTPASSMSDFLPEKAVDEKVRRGHHGRERSIQFRSGEVALIQDGWNEIHASPSPPINTTRGSRSGTEPSLGRSNTVGSSFSRGHTPSASTSESTRSLSRRPENPSIAANPWTNPTPTSSTRTLRQNDPPPIPSTFKSQTAFADPLLGGAVDPNPWTSPSSRFRQNPSPAPSSTSSVITESSLSKPLPNPIASVPAPVLPPASVNTPPQPKPLATSPSQPSQQPTSASKETPQKMLDPLGVL
ncbi:phosphatases II [Atractiella rhizophila]|nr:phosphatases II [Atractiella rhizophila]